MNSNLFTGLPQPGHGRQHTNFFASFRKQSTSDVVGIYQRPLCDY